MNLKENIDALPISKNYSILKEPLKVGNTIIPNRLAIQPMEGGDSFEDGSPSELTTRRYDRFSKSKAGLIWFEAVAVQENGRGNPRQLWLTEENLDTYKRLISNIKENAYKQTGVNPIIIMQATHSGRYAKPNGKPKPIIAYNNPLFERDNPLPSTCIITDDELKQMEQNFGKSTVLAQKAGFDGIDIKCCHRYLNSELLSAYTRVGEYGGSFENRTRFYRNTVEIARTNAKNDFFVTSRLNIYDGFEYPYGFGVSKEDGIKPDLTEPIRLIKLLNFDMLNITMGNPYVNSQVNRPVDIEGVVRMYQLTKQIQDEFPNLNVISSAPTYLKEDSGYLAAGAIEQGYCKMVGFGRMSFAYPKFAKDILDNNYDKNQSCITCGKCTELLRTGHPAGCVIRDQYYTELYRKVNAK